MPLLVVAVLVSMMITYTSFLDKSLEEKDEIAYYIHFAKSDGKLDLVIIVGRL
jgi:hypothetical protein